MLDGAAHRALRLPLPGPAHRQLGPRGRYLATLEEIAQRYAEWQIVGPAEIRDVDPGERYFTPHIHPLDAELRRYSERPPELHIRTPISLNSARSSDDIKASNYEPPVWRRKDGTPIACLEKIKVLNENLAELRQIAQDAFEDALLLECPEEVIRNEFHRLVDSLCNPWRTASRSGEEGGTPPPE